MLEIVRVLADRGPLANSQLSQLVGCSSGRVSTLMAVHDGLFERTVPGHRQSPLALSPEGRRVAAALPRGAG